MGNEVADELAGEGGNVEQQGVVREWGPTGRMLDRSVADVYQK